MADLEATGANATVYLRSTAGADNANDYRFRRNAGSVDIGYYSGAAWLLVISTNTTGDVFVPRGGIASGSTARTDALRWAVFKGTLPAAGTTQVVNLTSANKTLVVIGALYDQQLATWNVYDFRSTAGDSWYLSYTRAGGGDQATITFSGNYNSQSYVLIEFYEP